jgi:copper chaperone CopZ
MKHILLAIMTSLLLMAGGKDLRELVLTPTPQMHCANCENKIKNNMRFEKGVVKIETSVEQQTVVITYNGKKTDAKALQTAMKKIGYDTRVVSDKPVTKGEKKKK